jgi:quercetin dioxygenase-like cupin family protein
MSRLHEPFVPVGTALLFENDMVRIWEVKLEPGQRHGLHHHEYPYIVISIEHGDNQIRNLDGATRDTHEPPGHFVVRPAGEIHELTNVGSTRYLSRLIELKYEPPKDADLQLAKLELKLGMGADAPELKELLIDAEKMTWRDKSLPGLSEKMLWRNEETGASISLVRFRKGSGIPEPHKHASNQFMYCLSGRYEYTKTGLVLTQGTFYMNPKGAVHGPTLAQEDSVLLEVYDGPHYPEKPAWYADERDAR